tara:strand:+ start:278 stop:574 length:297 start_codon:yes stop_codon:yes gene_type:complete
MPTKESIPFNVGDLVTYTDHQTGQVYDKSDIAFVSNEYIVVCIHRELKTPEEAEHAVSKWREVKILVYQQHWHTIIPRNSHVDLKESPISNPQARRHD